jgi:hypothetical protein
MPAIARGPLLWSPYGPPRSVRHSSFIEPASAASFRATERVITDGLVRWATGTAGPPHGPQPPSAPSWTSTWPGGNRTGRAGPAAGSASVGDHRPALRHAADRRPTAGQRESRAASPQGRDQGQVRPLPAARQTVAPARTPEPGRLRHRPDLRSRIPGRRQLLPPGPGRLAAGRPPVERPDVHAEDPGRQAPLQRRRDGRPPQGGSRHRRRPASMLRGQARTAGQEGPGSTIRRDTPQAEQARGHHRPRPGSRSARRAGSWSTGSAGGGASYASRARRWQSTRSPRSPTSAGQDRASPRGRPS